MYKIVGLDLDGTITQHKSKLEDASKIVLLKLKEKYHCVIVGAGSCDRIYKQLEYYPIDVIGNYGMQQATNIDGAIVYNKNDKYTVDKKWFIETIDKLRQITGFTKYDGESVEFHESGAVTFPLLGTKALLHDKLNFDPKGEKRTKIYDTVSQEFSNYNCFIGGTSSFDIVLKKYDKFKALMKFATEKGVAKEDILYIGDDFKKGGNDEQVMLGGIDCINITDYKKLSDLLVKKAIIEE